MYKIYMKLSVTSRFFSFSIFCLHFLELLVYLVLLRALGNSSVERQEVRKVLSTDQVLETFNFTHNPSN